MLFNLTVSKKIGMLKLNSLVVLCFFIFCAYSVKSQHTAGDIETVKKVADLILEEAVFKFRGEDNNKIYNSTDEIPDNVQVEFASKYGEWHYTNGVLNMAMINLSEFTGDEKYSDFARRHVAFGFDNYKFFQARYTGDRRHYHFPFGQLWTMSELDDCGAMGACVIEVYGMDKRPEYREYIVNSAKHISEGQERLSDGSLARTFPHEMTLWADDLYMSVPFLVRMAKFSDDDKYFDDAILQVKNFTKHLWDEEKELFWHCYYSDLDRNGVAHWGRCNGWIILAQAHLLEYLPEDHPEWEAIRKNLERQIVGVARYQNGQGLWHQVLDRTDSYTESSCSAMFVYAVAKSVNEGWIDGRYASVALQGWEGLKEHKLTDRGEMKDVCVGTGIRDDMVFYYNRPARLNEKHGLGALIDAGIEVIKLKQSLSRN